MELEEIVTSTEQQARDKEKREKEEKEKAGEKNQQSPGDKSATPNLNAWLKAFGVPKKQKKSEDEDSKKDEKATSDVFNTNSQNANSPTITTEQNFTLPAPRTRKASTGSTISERSSYSQDPDSPRIGIDERICGAYPAPYPSPLGASPIMTSPKDDIQTKPTSPYASMNGAIRVGFYQDTTTKSSPEKSCSPREQPSTSPYSSANYAQHLYPTSTVSTEGTANAYGSYTSPAKVNQNQNALGFNNKNKTPSYFDQYKQPKSQDSDYNSSVGSNPNSPYQSQHSPYQSENSPYQQPQTSPYTQQPNSIQSNASQQHIPNSPNSPYAAPTSPYHNNQQPLSPLHYSQENSGQQQQQPQAQQQSMPQHSPYNQQSSSQETTQATSSNFHSDPSSPYSQQTKADLPYSAQSTVHSQHLTSSLPKTSPQQSPDVQIQNVVQQQHNASAAITTNVPSQQTLDDKSSASALPQLHSQPHAQPVPPSAHNYMSYSNAYSNHYTGLTDPAAPSMITSSTMIDKPKHDDEPRDILNLDYVKQTTQNKCVSNNKPSEQSSHIESLNKSQQQQQQPTGYDHMFEPMGFNKNFDISSTKAIEMFNRAATMSFSKTFPTPLSSTVGKSDSSDLTNLSKSSPSGLLNSYQPPPIHSNYSLYPLDNKTSHLGYNPHEIEAQQAQHLDKQSVAAKHGLYVAERLDPMSSTPMSNNSQLKANELNMPPISHRYDIPNYKTSSTYPTDTTATHIDLNMRNIIHPMIDDNLNGLPAATPNCYYPQKDHGAQSLYNKNVLPASQSNTLSTPNPYNTNRDRQTPLQHQPMPLQSQPVQQPIPEPKPKRTRKKKNAEPPQQPTPQQPAPINHQMMQQHNLTPWNSLESANQQASANHSVAPPQQTHSSILHQQHPQHLAQIPPSQQGFQSYAASLKPQSPSLNKRSTPPSEATAISLKTNSLVGSAFNFGPTSNSSLALGLPPDDAAKRYQQPPCIYGENSAYLDDYRASTNPSMPYYLPPQTHRTAVPSDQSIPMDNNSQASGPVPPPSRSPAPTYHQFLPHHASTRSTYPFINPSLDTNSRIYQQYLHSEEYRQRVMFANHTAHSGLLTHSAPTYPVGQPSAYLSMHKPYDAMNRPSWFQ